jgi:hypothetical protein
MKEVRDRAAAMQHYLCSIKAGQQEQNRVAVVKIRAERRLGEELSRLPKATPRGSNQHKDRSHDATVPPTLGDLGITKTQSSRWQAIAFIPEDDFEKHIAEVKRRGEELTSAGVLRLAKRLSRNSAIAEPADNTDTVTNGGDADAVAEIANMRAELASLAGMPTEEESRPDAVTKSGGAETVGKARDVSETPEPEEPKNHSGAEQTAQTSPVEQQEVAERDGLQIEGSVDSPSERDPLCVRAALQLIGPFARVVSKLPQLPNRELISGLLRDLFAALAPACFENPIPKKAQRNIVRPLRDCGFEDIAVQLSNRWAEADASARGNGTQLEMFPRKSSSGG